MCMWCKVSQFLSEVSSYTLPLSTVSLFLPAASVLSLFAPKDGERGGKKGDEALQFHATHCILQLLLARPIMPATSGCFVVGMQ